MTSRNRVRTPRRIKDWANSEVVVETIAANQTFLHSVLGPYYSNRGVNSIPGLTIMKIIGHLTVRTNNIGGDIDMHFGMRLANKDVSVTSYPIPYVDDSNWMWQERVLDTNFLMNNGATGVVVRHRLEVDLGARRKLQNVEERLFFSAFNSDATDSARYSFHFRVLLALP